MVRFSTTHTFKVLPLVLLGIMATLGLVIEAVRYGTLLWATKIPLAVLLAVAFFRTRREG